MRLVTVTDSMTSSATWSHSRSESLNGFIAGREPGGQRDDGGERAKGVFVARDEYSFAWLTGYRRLTRRYESSAEVFTAFLALATKLTCYERLAT